MAKQRLERDRLVQEAIDQAGHDDFGEPTWQEGLERLLGGFEEEARLTDLGVEIAAHDVVNYLANRGAILAWRKQHPAVAAGEITAPVVIVGQPRTGTTILYDLLAQDPSLRAPLTWEVDRPVPPPETATYEVDPRIAEVQAEIDLSDSLIPGFTSFHPLGARLAQECVRITGGDFRSMIFPTQYRLPSYARWLIHEADLAPAYRWHRVFLQHLQSRHTAPRWLLKSPAHLWHLPELAAEYPGALIVQTHRDPLKVIASVSALTAHLRRMASNETSIAEAAAQLVDHILVSLERAMRACEAGVFPPAQIVDVHFTKFIDDPFATIRAIYDRMGMELTIEAEARMRDFLAAHPGDGGGGGKRYRFADTGLDAGELRARAAAYQERYGVVSEPAL